MKNPDDRREHEEPQPKKKPIYRYARNDKHLGGTCKTPDAQP
jgi:hypothetical protein